MIFKYLKRFKLIKIMLILTAATCLLVSYMLLISISDSIISNKIFNKKLQIKEYILSDSLDQNNGVALFFRDINRLEDLKKFVYQLEHNDIFNSYTIYKNPVSILNHEDVPSTAIAYGDKSKYKDETTGDIYLTVKAIQITDKLSERQNITLQEGRYFTSEDYVYNDNNSIKVILGSYYKEHFTLYSKIKIDYWGIIFDTEIIGFADTNAYVTKNAQDTLLNDFIILPFLDCNELPRTESENLFQGISYTSRINAIISSKTDRGIVSTYNEIDRLCGLYDLPSFYIIDIPVTNLAFTSSVNQFGTKSLIYITCILVTLCIVAFFVSQSYILKANKYLFGVHILNGLSRHQMLYIAFYDMSSIIIMANLIALAIILAFRLSVYLFIYSIPVSIIILTISYIVIYFNLKHKELSNYLESEII